MRILGRGDTGRQRPPAIISKLFSGNSFLRWRSTESSSADLFELPQLSAVANSVVSRCSKILDVSLATVQQNFEDIYPDISPQGPIYAAKFLEYCCHRALHKVTGRPDYLADQDFQRLMFDMMLASEDPYVNDESSANGSLPHNLRALETEDEGSIFHADSARVAAQVDDKRSVGLVAFKKIAPSCPEVADMITVHNIFDALTCSSSGRLHFLIFEKYLKCLDKVLKSAKTIMKSPLSSSLHLADGEYILAVDGHSPIRPVLQHIGVSAWPGRLILTTHFLYFEYLQVGSGDKVVKYDLYTQLNQVIRRDFTGPLGIRLFGRAVMYKSDSLTEPVSFAFPEMRGHSRQDYWLSISSEVLQVNKFIREYNLGKVQRGEALSIAILGIFRCSAIKEALRIVPSNSKTVLAFDLAEKIPKGDFVLEAMYNYFLGLDGNPLQQLVTESSKDKLQVCLTPYSLHAMTRMGFELLKYDLVEKDATSCPACTGFKDPLEKALDESLSSHKRAEVAQASVDQVKVEGIAANIALLKELLYPFIEITKLIISLSKWEDFSKSASFLFLTMFIIIRGWFWLLLPVILISCALIMQYHKYFGEGKPLDALEIPPPTTWNAVEQLLSLQDGVSRIEEFLQEGNIVLLKIRSLMHAVVPKATDLAALVLAVAAACLTVLHLKHLLLFIFLEVYTRNMPLRKQNERFRRRCKEWWARIPAAPVRMIKSREEKKKR